ncbi:hypothetical protein D1006_33330 [Burkholderia stabilis]|uniref:Uncharacterized protein n=2 Tax=Burkholderia TaxID=32008 RepID=A0A4Q2A739_9BURK|nr:hypothetical protein D1006_33330 [Burkholderia stabilis]
MTFGDCESDSATRGIVYLQSVQQGDGFWWAHPSRISCCFS